jgi:predicted nuclease of restriction endonuclease-like RecB superfamily
MRWPEAVATLAAERTRAETCVRLLKRHASDDAAALSRELSRDISPVQVRAWLYADLPALLHVTRWHLTATLVPRERWAKTPTAWRLEREVDLIPLPGSVMVPDFRLVHPDGRSVLLELVGYWRPEYLRKKFAQVRRAGREDVILAVSERVNLEGAGVRHEDIPARVVWFKDHVLPKAVLAVLEG